MAKGIIYVMTTVVPGLIKIGKTGTESFESRMYQLERNGYCNVVGLQRKFAIEVEDYDTKETLLHDIFSKSNVPNTELFSLDANLVVQLLSSFEGRQVYPQEITKEEVFETAVTVYRRAAPFRFSMCNISVGAKLEFWKNAHESSGIFCTVLDDAHVSYQGERWSLTSLAKHLIGSNSEIPGPKYFKYNDEWLNDIRERNGF